MAAATPYPPIGAPREILHFKGPRAITWKNGNASTRIIYSIAATPISIQGNARNSILPSITLLQTMKNIPIQPLCDTAMLALFLLLMADRHMENAFHEWLGVILLALLCLHTWLNWKWYALLLHGCYPLRRSIRLILNLLLLAAFSGTVATATFLSKTVFAFLALKGELLARTLYVCCAHWSFVLASFHLGLYWNTFWSSCKHISWLRLFSLNKALGVCLSLVIVFYGVWAFLQRNLLDPLMLRSAFMFWTEQDNLWKMLYDYATIFFTGAWLVHTIVLVKKRRQRFGA